MVRVVGGVVTSALLIVGLASCTSGSDPETPVDASKNVAVEPDEVVRHEAASGTPISFGIDVPDGAVQVGPLIRQRRLEVEEVIENPPGDRADAFGNDETGGQEDDLETHDPEEPAPPDFTTALLRVDDDPSEVLQNTLEEIEDALPESDVDPESWADYCTVVDGVYTGCEFEVSGKTEDDEQISVELTVDPGRPKSKVASAGSLLRPVMALTIEQQAPPAPDDEEGNGENRGDGDGPDRSDKHGRQGNTAQDARHKIDSPRAVKHGKRDDAGSRRDKGPRDDDPSRGDETPPEEDDSDSDKGSEGAPPTWPTMDKERPAEPGDWILTRQWKIQRNTEVILSTMSPKVAMLAVKDGSDADAIARRYVRAFADEATTPKIDEVEDRNERSITYTPRNDGSGPAVAVTAVATGRGNYIELLFSPDPTDKVERDRHDEKAKDRKGKHGKRGHRNAAKRTNSSTG